MIRKFLAAAAICGLAACASPAQTAETASGDRDCFRANDVNGFSVVDDHHVKARVSASREYILTLTQDTRHIEWSHALALSSPTSFICVGNTTDVVLRGGEPPMRHLVTRVERAPDDTPAGS